VISERAIRGKEPAAETSERSGGGSRVVGGIPVRGDGFRWVGPGQTALVIPASVAQAAPPGRSTVTRLVGSPAEASEAMGVPLGSTQESVLEGFFAAGGRRCRVLFVGAASRSWLGQDGGPGERTGLHALRDFEDITSVVVPVVASNRLGDFIDFAKTYEDLFLFLEERLDDSRRHSDRAESAENAAEVSCPSPNVALIRRSVGGVPVAPVLAGRMERLDLVDSRSAPPRAHGQFAGVGRFAVGGVELRVADELLKAVKDWRLWRGLRRSLDHGSRWVVFEPNHPLVWRRLEREVRAFLHGLALQGVLSHWAGSGLDVHCGPAPGESGRVVLTVRTDLADARRDVVLKP